MRQFIKSFCGSIGFLSDETVWNGLVIYSEGGAYAPYISGMLHSLEITYSGKAYYLTSDPVDPLLRDTPRHLRAFFIGKGIMRTIVFNTMRTKVLAMTMPDLNTFHIKRSPRVQHYTYFHHSLVSTHMVYRKGAFDHFDSMMCVGPYHQDEVREWEALHGLPPKQLFDHGSPPLDTLAEFQKISPRFSPDENDRLNVLLAPSWGPDGLMETNARKVVQILINAGHHVCVRPHPRTRQLAAKVLDELAEAFSENPNFEMNEDISGHDLLLRSHVMISDWSGVAMEIAFGLGRPVLFVDVPRKINNPDYTKLKTTPLEVWYREEVGVVIDLKRLDDLPDALASLIEASPKTQKRVFELRERLFYNFGNSAMRGAEILSKLAS